MSKFLIIQSISDTICLGETVTITWTGGHPNDLVYISLSNQTQNTTAQSIVSNYPNTGSYTWVCQGTGVVVGADIYTFYIQNMQVTSWDYGSQFFIDSCIYDCMYAKL